MDLQHALAHLYGLRPDEFIAARSGLVAAARAAKDRDLAKAVGELRKPSVSAWVVNRWARASPAEAGRLADLGGRLRQAQSELAGPLLRELSHERSTLLGQLTGSAVGLATQAGAIPSSAVEREVRETLTAALSSPEATAAATSGHLTRSLAYVGLGEVDLTAATAGPVESVQVGVADEMDAADEMVAADEAARRAAELEHASAARLADVTARQSAAQQRLTELEAELEQAQAQLMELTAERNDAARAHRSAQQATQVPP